MMADQEGSQGRLYEILGPSTDDRSSFVMASDSGLESRYSSIEKLMQEETGSSYAFPFSDNMKTIDDHPQYQRDSSTPMKGKGVDILASGDVPATYTTLSNRELVRQGHGRHKNSFAFVYIADSFDYRDSRGVFERTFENSSGSAKNGLLMVNWKSRVGTMPFVEPYWLINAGIGHNMGEGQFVDGTESDATFTLWMLPVDIGLGLDLSLSSWLKIGFNGGPSALGLIQNRSDIDSSEGANTRRQGSYGYFYEAHAGLNLSEVFPKSGHRLLANEGVSSYYLTFKMRTHGYQNFKQEDFEISGTSFGVGFTFEFL